MGGFHRAPNSIVRRHHQSWADYHRDCPSPVRHHRDQSHHDQNHHDQNHRGRRQGGRRHLDERHHANLRVRAHRDGPGTSRLRRCGQRQWGVGGGADS